MQAKEAFVGRDEKRAPLKTPAWEARLALAETTRTCTRGFFCRSTPAETRPSWKCGQNHNYAVYGDASQNIRVLNPKGRPVWAKKDLLPFQMFRNNIYGKFSTEKDPQKSRA